MDSKYLMISFDDARLKSISETLGNPSCKKILNLLAEKQLGETEISRELAMPLNTVGYNVKKLIEAGLIEKAEHFWSIKGKKMPVYKISNKSIVISPKKTIASKIGGILPAVLITGIVALFIRFFSLQEIRSADKAVVNVPALAYESGAQAVNSISLVDKILAIASWEWFLLGSLTAIIIFSIIKWRKL